MKKLLLFLTVLCMALAVNAQNLKPVAKKINDKKQLREEFVSASLFTVTPASSLKAENLALTVSNATVMEFNAMAAQTILTLRPQNLQLTIPNGNGSVTVELFQSKIFTPDFNVTTAGRNGQPFNYTGGLHYWGIVKGNNASLAAISIYPNEVMGLITTPAEGNLVLGKLEKDVQGDHIFYNDKNLTAKPEMDCATEPDATPYTAQQLQNPATENVMVNCIRLFWEVNYNIFTDKGSVANAANYVIGLFNQSAIIYSNDNIPVELSEVFVWDVTSPYTGTTTSSYLSQFQNYRNVINGDLGHLLGYGGGGGVAAGFSGICASNLNSSQCYSGINSSYSNVPTYSWSVMVVTHEQGHLMGSRHTHACVWNGNSTAIDGCGPAAGYGYEGSCTGAPIPSGGGTIMSYCHLNAVGINLSLGFGTQPKNVIINNYNAGACLSACIGTGCMPAASMSTTNVLSTTATFNWAAAAGATSYNVRYRIVGAATWITATSATTSYNATGLTAGGNYEWQVQTVCAAGNSIFTISTNFTTTPITCLTPTGLSTTNVTSSSATFNWTIATGATSYTIQYRLVGAATWITTTSTGSSVTVFSLTASSNYEWQIQTTCSGGGSSAFSASQNFTTTAPPCNTPVNNFTTNITDVSATLNWGAAGSGASSYNLRYRVVGTATWNNTTATSSPLTISGLTQQTNYEWQVQAVCGQGTSAFSSSVPFTTLCSAVTATITPAGPLTFCAGGSVILNANTGTGYSHQWQFNNVNITGANSPSYTATAAGKYLVIISNGVCSATSAEVTVVINANPTPSISGATAFCAGGLTTLNAGAGYTSYLWSTGATTQSITVNTAGIFAVTVSNANGCTGSASVTTTIGTITASVTPAGPLSVCSGSSVTLTATAGSGYTYKWYRNNVLLTATAQTYTTGTAGTYKCVITSGTCTATSANVVLSVINNPTPTITASGPLSFCSGGSVTFTANTFTGVVYQWEKNSVSIPGATSQTYTATTTGTYRAKETANGCSKYTPKKSVKVNNCARVGASENETSDADRYIVVSPNPFSTSASITIDENVEVVNATMEVYNLLGNVVKRIGNINTNTVVFEKEKLQSGVYQVRIINGNGNIMNTRFVIR